MGRVRLDKLGQRIDGWADLLDDQAGQAANIRQRLIQRLQRRNMPLITLSHKDVMLGGLVGESRPYQISLHRVGTTVAVYVGEFGADLYVAWDVFVRLVWKWSTIIILFLTPLLLNLLRYLLLSMDLYGLFAQVFLPVLLLFGIVGAASFLIRQSFWAFYADWVVWVVAILVSSGGPFLLGDFFYFFYRFDISNLLANVAGAFVLSAALLALIGLITQRSAWAYFRQEYNHFRADDIAAMTLAVHKSILETLDEVGINTALVRGKEEFRGGRRERVI
ncbi:MAG: hypothetical protein Fur0021_24840 [Candidatus Promineifilaceae bacterium]